MFGFGSKQWVCTVCGYNVIGSRPDSCPFCSARGARMTDAAKVARRHRVAKQEITPTVAQLTCTPKLGLGLAAYHVAAEGGSVMIDCPAVYDPGVSRADAILFTHRDFIGAANQYRDAWGSEVWLHEADAELSIAGRHCVTERFSGDLEKFGVRGIHIGGHSPGFTVYIWLDVLFVCDYAYPPGPDMQLNPHGAREETRAGAGRLAAAVANERLTTVCGYNYVVPFRGWFDSLLQLI